MGLLEIASNRSFWRGVDYYEAGKVSKWKKIDNYLYEARVTGSKTYDVVIDVKHPKRSTCDCPHAEGTRRVCKHKVALYLKVFPDELQRVMKEIEEWEREEFQFQHFSSYRDNVGINRPLSANSPLLIVLNHHFFQLYSCYSDDVGVKHLFRPSFLCKFSHIQTSAPTFFLSQQ